MGSAGRNTSRRDAAVGQGTAGQGTGGQERLCDHPDCSRAGEYRAPRSRTCQEYYWFCLDHVRDYNRAWDYYRGMSPGEIEQAIRLDSVWQRPTWPLGRRGARCRIDLDSLHDDFGLFGDGGAAQGEAGPFTDGRQRPSAQRPPADSPEEQAMRTMDLIHPVTRAEVKTRYKELVKRFHPDTHGGDKATEEKLKVIIEAYKTLMSSLNA